ncbi:hypothetical protein Afil01_15550 [Actinorhabdospora filicis]|uniref:NIPSNAP protein n=1 Tax=Actinorhabdospora filicis TaxID=1785913 RepID=A0A9W6W895_9ACTN|nr:NIPSNAP family protein [Actinorhabdospora filicis]GLZ76748.1 hypothetical protein Afil01_15550 [Actinorhabdospora filicis]
MVIEIRTYRLKPGTAEEFIRVAREEVLPLLAAAGLRVRTVGRSLVAENGHEEAYLVREFDSIEELERLETAFYGGDAWREGPRDAIVSRILSYHSVVLDGAELGL